jgi:hypothetical protein
MISMVLGFICNGRDAAGINPTAGTSQDRQRREQQRLRVGK